MRHVTSAVRRLAARRKLLMVLPCIALLAAGVFATAANAKKAGAPACTSSSTAKYHLVTPGVLTVAVPAADKPMAFQNASGTKWIGFDPDLANYVAKQACISQVVFVEQEFSGLLAAVASRKYDIGAGGIGVTAARKQLLNFTIPYLTGYQTFISKGSAVSSSLGGLAGKRVGVITGTVEETYLKQAVPTAQAVEFPDDNSEVQALLGGQLDAAFLDGQPAAKYVKQYPQLVTDFSVSAPGSDGAWPISKKDTALLAALNRGLRKAIATGLDEKLTHKWLPGWQVQPQYKPKP